MHFFRLTLFITLGLFLTACGEENDSSVQSETSTIIEVDAGEDKRVKINEPVTMTLIEVPNLEKVSSYLWTYKENTLATTRSFSYTPTSLGVEALKISILYNDGLEVSDTVNVIVTAKDTNITIPTISDSLKREYLKSLNDARTKPQNCGTRGAFPATKVLKWNDKLYKAAYEHMQDLIESETFAHEGSGTESDWTGYTLGTKSNFVQRIESYDYEWSRLGENLGGGTSINMVEEMIQGWLGSDNHCANLMNPNFTEAGMVMIKSEGSLYTHYWGQEFGTPK
jgi:uncharacterized protein YkwD